MPFLITSLRIESRRHSLRLRQLKGRTPPLRRSLPIMESSGSAPRSSTATSACCRPTTRADRPGPSLSHWRTALRIGRLNANLLKEIQDGPQGQPQTLLNKSLDLLPNLTAIDLR